MAACAITALAPGRAHAQEMPTTAAPGAAGASSDRFVVPDDLDFNVPSPDGFQLQGRAGLWGFRTFGREDSIGTLELFPSILDDNLMLFGDARLFSTFQGQFGGSAGLGGRFRTSRVGRIFGGSLWYDADDSLDLSVSYITDSNIRTAIIEAHDRGASVRVILADPAGYPENDTVATVLANRGVPVRFLETVDLHAKLVISDGVAAVGSQNLSPTSLGDNREVGVLVTEASAVAPIQAQLDSDWAAATPP